MAETKTPAAATPSLQQDTGTLQWVEGEDAEGAPSKRSGHSLVVVTAQGESAAYLFGGCDLKPVDELPPNNELHKYSIGRGGGTWSLPGTSGQVRGHARWGIERRAHNWRDLWFA